ncbi:MAG: tRNA (adenosine(37)-N6)-threonylcarbamoyltransferase complex transferase subunit TsaD [Clostridia bacterium]|nr:tRNA (adenosine(37)-N6)-threonylcarbamoyltransferase complex transferase subunit TsaD [Clostridia bacterium]
MSTIIMGIESSCDETSCAIVKDGREILSNTIYSQIDVHKEYGGVVPELASRMHIEKISYVVDKALKDASCTLKDIDAISVTYGPGLVGALLCGVSYAKSLSYALKIPLVKVHHIKGHIAGNYLTHKDLEPPFLCLVVSGGHSHIIEVKDYNEYNILAKTKDDAAGEAFDKIGRVLNLPYPGGAKIDKISYLGDKNAICFPKVTFCDSYDFSFSGVKTSVINYLHRIAQINPDFQNADFTDIVLREKLNGNGVKQQKEEITKADILASFTNAIVSILCENTFKLAKEKGYDKIVLAGGVACNTHLRTIFEETANKENMNILYPLPVLCTDNAAMIASMGYYLYKEKKFADLNLNAVPYIDIENS